MKIYAPVKDFNGWRGNVRFINGVGETDNPKAIEWFRTHGYKVPLEDSEPIEKLEEKCDKTIEKSLEKCDEEYEMMGYAEKTPNFDDMTPNELRDWAKANGLGAVIKNTRNKEKLIELIRGCVNGC